MAFRSGEEGVLEAIAVPVIVILVELED